MTEYTNNLHLAKPDFNFSPWHDDVNQNMDIIDAAIKGAFDFGGITGVWSNSTAYTIGQKVIDTATNTIWLVEVDHTSAASPTTFAADRAANPTFWSIVEIGVAFRGTWAPATLYHTGDFVYNVDEHITAVALDEHTSTADIRVDEAAGHWVFVTDLKQSVDDAETASTTAVASAAAAAASETAAEAAAATAVASIRMIVSDTAPVDAEHGQMWWKSDAGELYIWYEDIDSSQWVQVNVGGPRDPELETFVTPVMYGAVGDGVTDDTTAFQAALDDSLFVLVPNPLSTYKVTTLTLNQGQMLIGQSQFSTPLVGQPFTITGDGVNPTLQVGNGSGDPRQITIRDLSITNNGASCIDADTAPNLSIEHCRLSSIGAAAHTLKMRVSYRAVVRECYIHSSGGGDAINALDNMNGMAILNNTVSGGTAGRAIQVGQAQGIRVEGNIIESSLHGIHVGADSEAGNGNCNGVIIANNYIEQCSTPLKIGTQFTISGLKCHSNYVSNQATDVVATRTAAIQFGRIRGGEISDNAFYVHATEDGYRIQLEDATGGFERLVVERNYINGIPANVYQYQGTFAANASVKAAVHATCHFDFKSEPITTPLAVADSQENFVFGMMNSYATAIGQDGATIKRGEITVQPGDWKMNSAFVSTAQSLQIKGLGRPILRWDSAAGATMLKFRDSVNALVENLILLGKSGAVPHSFIYLDDTDSTSGPASQNEWARIIGVMMGREHHAAAGLSLGAQNGIYIGGPNGVNNDQFVIRDCQIYDCSTAGINIPNAQSVWGSIENVQLDTCAKGLWAGSSALYRNLQFNRNTECDLVIFRDTIHDIVGFNAENSARVIDQSQNASININGGKVLLSAFLTDAYWAQFAAVKNVSLQNWWVDAGGTTGKKIKFTASSTQRGVIVIKNCLLPDGDSRAGYELIAGAATCGLQFDIEQGAFRAKGTLDGSVTWDPASLADGTTAQAILAVAAGAGIVANTPVMCSFSNTVQGMIFTGNCYSANNLYIRLWNETGGPIDLASGKVRWRKLADYEVKAKATITYNVPLLSDGTANVTTVTVPAALGDFVYWSSTVAMNSILLTSYVSAANTVTLRFTNESGGNLDPVSGDYTVHVVKETAFDFLGAKVVDPSSLADAAGETHTVTVPGAKVGDFAMASFSLDLQGVIMSAEISADDTASVRFQNETGGVIDLGSGVLKVGAFISLG